jgi:hypothetical protein
MKVKHTYDPDESKHSSDRGRKITNWSSATYQDPVLNKITKKALGT